jgi:hypothetical protein
VRDISLIKNTVIAMTDLNNPLSPNSQGFDQNNTAVDSRVLAEVAKALAGLRYGSVEITVHDGKVTQIEAKKKIRLN